MPHQRRLRAPPKERSAAGQWHSIAASLDLALLRAVSNSVATPKFVKVDQQSEYRHQLGAEQIIETILPWTRTCCQLENLWHNFNGALQHQSTHYSQSSRALGSLVPCTSTAGSRKSNVSYIGDLPGQGPPMRASSGGDIPARDLENPRLLTGISADFTGRPVGLDDFAMNSRSTFISSTGHRE